MANQSEQNGKSGSFKIGVILVLVACILLGWSKFGGKVYKDYTSAGEYVRQQFMKSEESFKLTCNSTDFNQILGITPVWEKITKEAVVHTGDPAMGDHLVFRIIDGYEINTVPEKKKDNSYKLLMYVSQSYTTTAAQEKELAKAAESILASLHLNGASDYDKVFAIYRYICDNVVYDYAHLEDDTYLLKYSAYAAATQGTAVCAGIADLFYYLANAAGLDARITTNDTHAWNFVRVDGKYYYLDATWDLGKSEDEYEYFLKGNSDFENHRGNITFGLFGFSNLLVHSSLGYDISPYAYGYDPYAQQG